MVDIWLLCYVGWFMMFNQEVVIFTYLLRKVPTRPVETHMQKWHDKASEGPKDVKEDRNLLPLLVYHVKTNETA